MKISLWALIFCYTVFAQTNWNNTVTTNINVQRADYTELFSNSFGNNVVLQNSNGSITYYLFNSSGGTVRSTTIESGSSALANITGSSNDVYILYKKDSQVKIKRSSDGGVNWSTLSDLAVNASEIDAVYFQGSIHLVYCSNSTISYYNYNISWNGYFSVSGTESGYNPRIEPLVTDDKLYVVYNRNYNNYYYTNSREYDLSSGWEASTHQLYSSSEFSRLCGFGVDNSNLYLFLSQQVSYDYNLVIRKVRRSDYVALSDFTNNYNPTTKVQAVTDANNVIHFASYMTVYLENDYNGVYHLSFPGGTFSSECIYNTYDDIPSNVEISSTYNDLFVTWRNEGSNYSSYRQYDLTPSTPANLSMSSENQHPKLTWDKNPDADLKLYHIYKKIGSGTYGEVSSTSNTSWTDPNETVCTAVPPQQCQWETLGYYKVLAEDEGSHTSGFSNEVDSRIIGDPPDKIISGDLKPLEYSLSQNYPNPFNPSTRIDYSVKEKGFVTLKVYNVLGIEVLNLVNKDHDSGKYTINLSASALPSGIYIYSLKVNGYSKSYKMTLLK